MKRQLFSLGCIIFGLAVLDGCKKAETTAPASPQAEKADSPKIVAAKPATAGAKEKGLVLKVKWPVGNRYVYRMDMDQELTNHIPQLPKPMQQHVTMSLTYAISVDQATADDGRAVSMEFLSNEMEVKMGDQVVLSFDSKESGKNDPQNPISAPFRKMIGTKVHMDMNADGSVEKVNLDDWQKSVVGDDPGGAGAMLSQQFNEGTFRQMAGWAMALPKKPVQAGDTWPFVLDVPAGPMGKITVDSKITYKGMEDRQQHHCAVLASTGTFKGSGLEGSPMGKMSINNGTLTGTSWFDPDLGAMIESASDQLMVLKGDMPGQPGGNRTPASFTIELGQKIALNLVEFTEAKK